MVLVLLGHVEQIGIPRVDHNGLSGVRDGMAFGDSPFADVININAMTFLEAIQT